jgi:hypothetical protein
MNHWGVAALCTEEACVNILNRQIMVQAVPNLARPLITLSYFGQRDCVINRL